MNVCVGSAVKVLAHGINFMGSFYGIFKRILFFIKWVVRRPPPTKVFPELYLGGD